jgi:uncharacterized protein (DUF1330 family)
MKRIIIIVIALIIVAGGFYAFNEYSRKNKGLDSVKAEVTTEASALISDFENNIEAANSKYLGKIIAVTGAITAIEAEPTSATIVLGDDQSTASVRCSMDTTYNNVLSSLTIGQKVTVKGNCTGFNQDDLLGSDVILNRCVIQNGKNN